MPYNFGDSWLYDADPADQRHLQDATVDVLARLHAVDRPTSASRSSSPDAPGDTHLRCAGTWRSPGRGTSSPPPTGSTSPLIERGFAWLDDHWPDHEGDAVLSWGDSRIGNMMSDGFDPVAVLDWEMAGVGPRELDVAWLIYGHRIFEDIAAADGPRRDARLPAPRGRRRRVRAAHRAHARATSTWYVTYAALQFAIVFLRTGARSGALR